jgi:hypothetical protein
MLETSDSIDLATWIEHWWACARYSGEAVPDLGCRIETLLTLWRTPINGGWERGVDAQLLGRRYRRGDAAAPHSGEHAIEAAVLAEPLERLSCFSGTVIDGVNAVPLALDRAGGRAGNVEADLFLLVENGPNQAVLVVEVKTSANNAWYAAIQNLLQLRLTKESQRARSLFQHRHAHACFTHPDGAALSALPHTGVVLAPSTFYCQEGKKANAVAPTQNLLTRFADEADATVVLATWNGAGREIDALPPNGRQARGAMRYTPCTSVLRDTPARAGPAG